MLRERTAVYRKQEELARQELEGAGEVVVVCLA